MRVKSGLHLTSLRLETRYLTLLQQILQTNSYGQMFEAHVLFCDPSVAQGFRSWLATIGVWNALRTVSVTLHKSFCSVEASQLCSCIWLKETRLTPINGKIMQDCTRAGDTVRTLWGDSWPGIGEACNVAFNVSNVLYISCRCFLCKNSKLSQGVKWISKGMSTGELSA